MNEFVSGFYSSTEIFEKEKVIYENSWVFVGLTSSLKEDGDYFLKDILGRSLIIRNSKGTIKCFANSCRHRQSKILLEKNGNSKLVCPYHNWVYADTGKLLAASHSKTFSEKDLCNISLTEFRIEVVGKFVFLNISKNPVPISEWLGSFEKVLIDVSTSIKDSFHNVSMSFNANWKLVVENTLEAYHINSVHPTTFTRIGIDQNSIFSHRIEKKHSSMTLLPVSQNSGSLQKLAKIYAHEKFKGEGFYHLHVFPNLLIGSTLGISFYVGEIERLSPHVTSFNYSLHLPTSCNNAAVESVLEETVKEFTKTVLEEDREIVEGIQQNSLFSSEPPIFSEKEVRLKHFQDQYLDIMGK